MVVCDSFPVAPLHSLVIPKRHVADYFDLYQSERNAIDELLQTRRRSIAQEDPTVEGWNIGINSGAAAGQTIFHCHVHLIPRRWGDIAAPAGGIRHVIPGKGDYSEARPPLGSARYGARGKCRVS